MCFFSFVLKNKVDVSLFWEIWGHQRLPIPSDHKIGRKLPFGQKYYLMGFTIIQEDDYPKEEFQDEPIKEHFTEYPKKWFHLLSHF